MLVPMDRSAYLFGAFAMLWVVGLFIGMAYIRGGREAVRNVLPRLAIVVLLGVLVFLVEALVASRVGRIDIGLVLLPVVLVLIVLQIRRYRQVRATEADDVRASAAFTPAIRNFAIVAIVILMVGSIVLSFLASRIGL